MSTNRYTVKLYWEQVRRHKTSFFVMLVAIPTASLLIDTLLPYFFSQSIGGLAANSESIIRQSLIAAAIVGVIGSIINAVGFQAMVRHESKVKTDLSDSTFSRLINKDSKFFINEKVGALTSRYIDFIRSETSLQDLLIIRTLGFILSVGTGLAILASQSLLIAGIVSLLIITLVVQIRWSMKKRAPWRHERKTLNGELNGLVADAVTNSVTVKTFGKEPYEINELHKKNKRFEHLYIKDIGFVVMEGSIRVAIMAIVQIIAIAISAYLVINGRMNIATAVFILTYLQRISSQIFTLGDIINGYDRALLEAAPMSDILANPTTVNDSPNAQNVDLPHPDIHLDNVSYKYEDADDAVLHNINLMIKAGEKIGVVGHSGSGKSTLTHLLLRFSDVTGGAIKIGGHDIRDITQDSLRNHIAYVPQEPALFHRSIRDNIAYGQLSASDQDVELAAKQANALDFINKLPNGINTLVGERGVKLSGGQRQRIAIARAILKDSPILILDEATSALDSESESLIQSALAKLMKNRTTIVIAHRLSTIAKLDRIIVLDNGKISEQGTHQELIALKGTYAKLWNHQSGGFIEE